jgi:hypothetical protein
VPKLAYWPTVDAWESIITTWRFSCFTCQSDSRASIAGVKCRRTAREVAALSLALTFPAKRLALSGGSREFLNCFRQ